MATVANLQAVFTLQKSAFSKGLREAEKEAASASKNVGASLDDVGKAWGDVGSAVGKALKPAAVAIGVGTAAATAFGVASVKTAASVDAMDRSLAAMAKSQGLSKAAMDEQINAMVRQGTSLSDAQTLMAAFTRAGLDMAQANVFSKVAADLSVFTGQNPSETLNELIHAVQTGNGQLNVFRQLGIQSGQVLSAYAATLGKTSGELTQTERQQALLNAVIEAGVPIAGSFEATWESASGMMGRWPSLVKDIQTSLGQALMPAVMSVLEPITKLITRLREMALPETMGGTGELVPLFQKLGDFARGALEPIGSIITSVTAWISNLDRRQVEGFANALTTTLNVVKWLAPLVLGLVAAFKFYNTTMAITKAVQTAVAVTQAAYAAAMTAASAPMNALTFAQWALNVAMSANPIGLVVIAIGALVGAFVLAYMKIEPFRNAVNQLGQTIVWLAGIVWSGIQQIVRFFQWLWEQLVGGSIIPDLVNAIIGWFTNLWSTVTAITGFIRDMAVAVWSFIRDRVVAIVQGWADSVIAIWNFVSAMAVAIWSWIRDAVSAIVTALVAFVIGRFEFWRDQAVAIWTWVRDAVIGFAEGLRQGVSNTISAMVEFITGKFTDFKRMVRDALQWVIEKVNAFLDKIFDKEKGLGKFGISIDWRIPDLPGLARGGVVSSPAYMVGEENRPETVIPWNPAYRNRAADLWTLTGKALGFFRGFASGGVWFKGNFPITQGPGPQHLTGPGAQAWDYGMPNGTPLYMGLPGVVFPGPGGGYGISIGVNLDSGGSVILAHLQQGPLRTGRVDVGELIGYSDNTGNSTGPHLHLEFRGTNLTPGQGSGESSGLDILGMIGGWARDIIGKYGPEEPEFVKGALNHFVTGSVQGIGGWIMENFRSIVRGAKEFAGELWGRITGKVTKSMLGDLLDRAGWNPEGGLEKAYTIMMRESGGDPNIVGPRWNGDRGSVGLFQIQTGAHPQFDFDKLMDPLYNVQAAKYVYGGGTPGWRAWSTNYDRGGLWPSGTGGFNGSGGNELVLNAATFGRLLSVLERLDTALMRGGVDRPITVNNRYESPGGGDTLQDLILALRMT